MHSLWHYALQWKTSANLRVFIPLFDAFKDIPKAILIDSDTVVGADIAGLWGIFDKFTPKQLVAVAGEQV
jgi:lipopolysaccharide biosynthesis glycosyltransferase